MNLQIKAHSLEEHEIAVILLKVVQTIDALHAQGKVHSDITISTITLSETGDVTLLEPRTVESILKAVPEVNEITEDDQKVCQIIWLSLNLWQTLL